jgi:hypothetical protein
MMFNSVLKKQFLDNYPDNSQPIYQRVFGRSEEVEIALLKDLYEFNLDEIEKVLEVLEPKYISTARTNGRIISAYINWATQQGLRDDGKNPLDEVQNPFFEQFVGESNLLPFITNEDLNHLESFCENAQDAVIFRLLFEGVQGKENAEIRNLRNENGMIDWDYNKLILIDMDGTQRTLQVSERCMHLIEEALSEMTYYKRNGNTENEAPSNVRGYTDLVDSNFVIRSSVTKTDSINKPVDKYVIYRRIALIGELFTIPNLNAKNIVRSGMLYMGYKLLQERSKLDKEAYVEIAKRFKINTMPALREIVNEETISELYER